MLAHLWPNGFCHLSMGMMQITHYSTKKQEIAELALLNKEKKLVTAPAGHHAHPPPLSPPLGSSVRVY
jgi:hypothetical protein